MTVQVSQGSLEKTPTGSTYMASGIQRNEDLPSPRCPHLPEVTTVEEMLPFLESVAKRPYSHGLWPAWDLQKGEKVLVRMTSWHHPLVIEAVEQTMKNFEVDYTLEIQDKGEPPVWEGADEVEYYLERTKELAKWMDEWREMDANSTYDKIIMGYGGPVLAQRKTKIQRMPFIVPEQVATPAHLTPAEVLKAIDDWTWERIAKADRVHLTDPEGTDIWFTNHAEYWNEDRTLYRRDHAERTAADNIPMWENYLPGHIYGRPPFHLKQEDGNGVIAGTMNHIAPYPRIELEIRDSKIVEIRGGGEFGEKLRDIAEKTEDIQYPGYNTPGIMQWWEASIGTSPKIHRPREDYPTGYNCGLYERMRAGIIHIGFGTVISSDPEREAARNGDLVGHWHVHLNFPTYVAEGPEGSEVIIDNGHLMALDDPEIRAIAAKYGDPDEILREDWIPAIPGLNLPGDYDQDFASDPMDWTLAELHICRKYHQLFMQMIGATGDHSGGCH